MGRGLLLTLLSVLGALALVVSACAPAATPTPTATPTPPPVVATPTPTTTPPSSVTTPTPGVAATPLALALKPPATTKDWDNAQYGGIMRWSARTDPAHFDYQRTITWGVGAFTGPIFSKVVRMDPYVDSPRGEASLRPDLAERWERSADGLTITFYLRRDVKWHDGKPFTAKDVKYSIEKLMDPARSAYPLRFSSIDQVEIVDDYAVKLHLNFPDATLLQFLAMGSAHVQAEHLKDVNYRSPDFLVGTGPFKFKSMTPGVDFVVEKNSDYFVKGLPYFDGMRWRVLPNEAAAMAFVAGALDFAGAMVSSIHPLGGDGWKTVQKLAPEAVFQTTYGDPPQEQGNYINSWFFFSYVKSGPWWDKRVRKAMSLAINYDEMRIAAGTDPEEMLRGGIIPPPPTTPWGMPANEWYAANGWDQPEAARLTEAKRLMAEAGFADGFKAEVMNIDARGGIGYSGTPLYIKDRLMRTLKIDLTYVALDRAVSLPKIQAGDFNMFNYAYSSSIGDPGEYLETLHGYNQLDNYGKYNNSQLNAVIDQIRRETDFDKRLALVRQAERIVIQEVPYITYGHTKLRNAQWPYLKGYRRHPGYSNIEGDVLWFDQTHPLYKQYHK